MFEPLIEKYISRGRPAVMATVGEARAWLAAIHSELCAIRSAIEENRETYQRVYMPFELAANAQKEFTIPANEEWILETAVMEVYSAASILRITDAEAGWNPPGVVPIPYCIFHPSTDTTENPNVRFRAGTHVLIVADGDGGRYRLQFRKERHRGAPVPAGQFTAPLPQFAATPGAAQNGHRHESGGVFAGQNIVGAARAAGDAGGDIGS